MVVDDGVWILADLDVLLRLKGLQIEHRDGSSSAIGAEAEVLVGNDCDAMRAVRRDTPSFLPESASTTVISMLWPMNSRLELAS